MEITALYFKYDNKKLDNRQLGMVAGEVCKRNLNGLPIIVLDGLLVLEQFGKKINQIIKDEPNKFDFSYIYSENEIYWAYKIFSNYLEKISKELYEKITYFNVLEGIEVIVLLNWTQENTDSLSKLFQKDKSYIGNATFEIDNNFSYYIYIHSLVMNCVIDSGKVYISEDVFKCDFNEFIQKNIIHSEPELEAIYPKPRNNFEVSAHSLDENDFWQDLLESILLNIDTIDQSLKFSIESKFQLTEEDFEDMSKKLTEYCLNKEHETGKHKARVFDSILGIKKEDYKFLQAQLIQGLKKNKVKYRQLNCHGINFGAKIKIQGKNGKMAIVTTGWIYDFNKRNIRLTTAYIEVEKQNADAAFSKIVYINRDEFFFENLYEAATEYADEKTKFFLPTPYRYVNKDGLLEINEKGKSGNATISILNEDFAKWLNINRTKDVEEMGKRIIINKFNNHELSTIYAEYMVEVFRINEVECKMNLMFE